MVEEWRMINGQPNYEVSNHGRVRRVSPGMGATPGRILKATITSTCPYPAVSLYKDDVRSVKLVHKLVIETFLGSPTGEASQVNHIDADKTNPRLDNLEYVTPKGNMGHAIGLDLCPRGTQNGQNVLTEESVRGIRQLLKSGKSQSAVSRLYAVSQSSVSHIHTGKQWGWLV